jgi:hypothetical protein
MAAETAGYEENTILLNSFRIIEETIAYIGRLRQ